MQKPSNKVFELARTRYSERWEDLNSNQKIMVILDLMDEQAEAKNVTKEK